MRWSMVVASTLLAMACSDDERLPSSPRAIDAGAPGGCELVVARPEDCPSLQEICGDRICNAAHDCCYPISDGWGDTITDCPICPDGGPGLDAP